MDKTITNINKIIPELVSKAINLNCPHDTVGEEFNKFVDFVLKTLSSYSDEQLEIIDKKILCLELNPKVFSLRLAIKIIISRRFFENGLPNKSICVNVINPVYKEKKRMSPLNKRNPFGENTIIEKIKIYKKIEILSGNKITIKFWVVDDVCPEKSGKLAEKIIKDNFSKDYKIKYNILYLEDAIKKGLYPPKNNVNGSIKGAAFHYALKTILDSKQTPGDNLFLDTDDDLSIHPELLGLLLKNYYANKAVAVIGSRREKNPLSIIEHHRDMRGRLYLAILQKLLPILGSAKIWDTNRAAKLYNTMAAKTIVRYQSLWQFPYQIEDILILLREFPNQVYPQSVSYIDSVFLSTTTRRFAYYKQIIDQVYLSDKYQSSKYEHDLKYMLLHMGVKKWKYFEENVPDVIVRTPINKLKDLPIKNILEKISLINKL